MGLTNMSKRHTKSWTENIDIVVIFIVKQKSSANQVFCLTTNTHSVKKRIGLKEENII